MRELRYTFLSDGSSDQALIPLLTWTLQQYNVSIAIQPQWADLRRLPKQYEKGLATRITLSLELFPCDLLFIHRDAERELHHVRAAEIKRTLDSLSPSISVPVVCVVPVRMQEAWLLFDEMALRNAAGNQNGRQPLQLPPIDNLEQLPDPKSILHELLREASGLHGRRRKKFLVNSAVHRVSYFIEDFSPLRALPAFKAFEFDLQQVVQAHGWNTLSVSE